MNKAIKGVLTVSGCCILAGAVLMTIGRFMGGSPGFWINKTGFHTNSEFKEASKQHLSVLEKTELEGFDEMFIDAGYNDIEVIPSKDGHFYIEYRLYSYGPEPEYRVEQGKLSLTCGQEPQNSMDIGVMVWSTGQTHEQGSLKLYVPEHAALKMVQLTSSDGCVKYDGPNSDEFNLTSSYGNVTLKDKKAKKVRLNAADGKIDSSSVVCEEFILNNSYGNTDLDHISADKIEIEVSDGNVTMTGIDSGSIDIVNHYGGVKGNAVKAEDFSLEMSDGSCSLKRADLKKSLIENTYGSVEVELTGSALDYNYDLETTFGSITVGGREWEEGYRKDNGADRSIEGTTSDGDFIVSYVK